MKSSKLDPISKVSVFVIDECDRLLVFEHLDFPNARVQVPAGTIKQDEQPKKAAFRELTEETGILAFKINRFITRKLLNEVRRGHEESHDRWFFHATPTEKMPEEWMFGDSTDSGWVRFRFYWIDRLTAELSLTPDHAEVYRTVLTPHD